MTANRTVKHPELTLATVDHGVPTSNRMLGIKDPLSKIQIEALENNCKEFGVTLFGINDPRQGIVHVIGPEESDSSSCMRFLTRSMSSPQSSELKNSSRDLIQLRLPRTVLISPLWHIMRKG